MPDYLPWNERQDRQAGMEDRTGRHDRQVYMPDRQTGTKDRTGRQERKKGKFTEIFAGQGAPPVSTTPEANFATSFASVVDTNGKFATGVNTLIITAPSKIRKLTQSAGFEPAR